MNIYKKLAETILSFSNHNLSKGEFYDILSEMILNTTEDDKSVLQEKSDSIVTSRYNVARKWLLEK